jgi:hypothetical protein
MTQGGKSLEMKRTCTTPSMLKVQGTRPVPVLSEGYLKPIRAAPTFKTEENKVKPPTSAIS